MRVYKAKKVWYKDSKYYDVIKPHILITVMHKNSLKICFYITLF